MVRKRLLYALLALGVLAVAAFLALKPQGDAVVYQGKPLRFWALQASAGDPQAIAAIKSFGTNAVPGLVDVLGRKDSFLKRQGAALGGKVPRRLARPLLGWAQNRNTVLHRSAAAKVLGMLGPEAAPAVPALAKALHDPEAQVGWDAASALARIGTPAVPELMRALADPSLSVRTYAAYALGQMGPTAEAALPSLIEEMMGTNNDLRASAAYSAAIIGVPSMLALSNVLDHGDAKARETAVQQLVLFQRSLRTAVPALAKMAQAQEPSSRRLALIGLGALRLADNASINTLTNALSDPEPAVRTAAVKGLKRMVWRAHEALPQLVAALRDSSPEVREWTVSTLGDIGPRATAALPELRRLAETDAALRSMANQAIAQIEVR